MNRTFIIARQEFVKFVTRRGFLFTLIGVPLWIALAIAVPPMLAKSGAPTHVTFAVIDRSGSFANVLARAAARPDTGGKFSLVTVPKDLANAQPDRLLATLNKNPDNPKLDAVVAIPVNFDSAHAAQIWGVHDDTDLREFVQANLTAALRMRALRKLGDAEAQRLLDIHAKVDLHVPPPRANAAVAKGVSISIGIGSAILLLIVAMMNSAALLQGVIEEKSTRMVEVLLSCATPWEIITGKIVGAVAVALFMVLLWVGSALILGLLFAGPAIAGFAMIVLHQVGDPALLPLIVLYFLCGLLIYGAIFLSIGSMSASLADAQAYLGPSMMIIMLPNLFIGGILHDPNGPMAVAASYFPIYTPYVMLMRVPSNPPAIEIVTTVLPSVCTTVLLVWGAGTIFSRHALATEKSSLKGLFWRRS